jgi:hypothetical protein
MDDLVTAGLNLHAVLPNLEELVLYDRAARELCRDWRVAVQFTVRDGPSANVAFADGRCVVTRGKARADVVLYFTSPAHLNRMFAGKANPIPLWGFTRLGWLSREFARLTDRLTYFLKPTDMLLADPAYLALNTRLTLNVAALAVPVLVKDDPVSRVLAQYVGKGILLLQVLPDGPAVHVDFGAEVTAAKTGHDRPAARVQLESTAVANRFLGGKLDAFAAIAAGQVAIAGRIPMIDNISHILDRIPFFLA